MPGDVSGSRYPQGMQTVLSYIRLSVRLSIDGLGWGSAGRRRTPGLPAADQETGGALMAPGDCVLW